MAGDATGRSPVEYVFFGVIDFICLLLAAESLNARQYIPAIRWTIAGVASILVGYYWPKIKPKVGWGRGLTEPKIELNAPVIVDTTTNIAGLNRRFVQIPVSFRTRLTGRGQLLRVWRWENNNWIPTQVDEPLDLVWSILDVPIAVLEPDVARRLNVFFLQNDNRNINFASDRVPFRMALSSAPSDAFKFDVRVSDEGGRSKQTSFKATFGEKWDDVIIEELL